MSCHLASRREWSHTSWWVGVVAVTVTVAMSKADGILHAMRGVLYGLGDGHGGCSVGGWQVVHGMESRMCHVARADRPRVNS